MIDLTGKVAIVTGGNGGIGLGMGRGLARAGARVVVAARNQEKSRAAVAELDACGSGGATAIAADVTDPASVDALVRETLARCGRLDVLVNNAGIAIRKPPHQISLDEWHQVMNASLTSTYLCSYAAHPVMKAGGGGKIINIGSVMSVLGAAFAPAYAAAKGGIVQFTKVCATAWARDNIQVNVILPGFIDTELTVAARAQVEGLNERVLARTPAGRWGKPEDFAGIAAFLASSASDFITGAAIPVDGGYLIQA
jgi:2-deoxy-D-gluconate 3-dehydrogenase